MSDAAVVPGDIVSVTDEGLKSDLTPVKLIKMGWPNQFCVTNVIDDGDRVLYELDPCCNWMVDWKDENYPLLCRAHPAEFFSKMEGKHVNLPKKSRYFGVGIGDQDFISIAPAADGKSIEAVLKFPGRAPFSVDGTQLKDLVDKLVGKTK